MAEMRALSPADKAQPNSYPMTASEFGDGRFATQTSRSMVKIRRRKAVMREAKWWQFLPLRSYRVTQATAITKKRIRARENERKGVKPAPAEG